MSWFAARISSSARHSSIVRGLFMDVCLAPSQMFLMARSTLLCGAMSTDR